MEAKLLKAWERTGVILHGGKAPESRAENRSDTCMEANLLKAWQRTGVILHGGKSPESRAENRSDAAWRQTSWGVCNHWTGLDWHLTSKINLVD